MEKNQNETGITLSFFRSEAIHWTRNRMEKNACPRKPTDSQTCSVLIMVNPSRALAAWLGGLREGCSNAAVSPYRRGPQGRKEFCRRVEPSSRGPAPGTQSGVRKGGGQG